MIEFAAPRALWFALAALPVLAAYLVRRRARTVVVPFLPLWRAARGGRGSTLGARLSRMMDLLLALLASLWIALAAGSPLLRGKPSTVRDLVLVLDGGVALRAGERLSGIRAVATEELRRRAPGTRLLLLAVTPSGTRVWSGGDLGAALRFVENHDAGWQPAERSEAIALARMAAPLLRDPDLVFCTHRPGRPEGFRLRTVREAAPNAGIFSLEVHGDPEGGGKMARLGVRGEGLVTIENQFEGEVRGRTTTAVRGRTFVEVPLPRSGELSLLVRSDGDRFPFDDSVFLLLPERPLLRILVIAVGDASPFLAAALTALEETGAIAGPLERTTPAHLEEVAADYDLLLFDRCVPLQEMPRLPALFLAPPSGNGPLPFALGEWGDAPALFDALRDHVLLRGVDPGALPPRRARAILGGTPVLRAAPGPVLATGPGWVALGFDPDRTLLAASPAYPLFLRNAIELLGETRPAGEPEFLPTAEGPSGFQMVGDRRAAVNLLLPDLDLTPTEEESAPLPEVGEPEVADRSLVPHATAAALLLLLLGWWLFWRARPGAPA